MSRSLRCVISPQAPIHLVVESFALKPLCPRWLFACCGDGVTPGASIGHRRRQRGHPGGAGRVPRDFVEVLRPGGDSFGLSRPGAPSRGLERRTAGREGAARRGLERARGGSRWSAAVLYVCSCGKKWSYIRCVLGRREWAKGGGGGCMFGKWTWVDTQSGSPLPRHALVCVAEEALGSSKTQDTRVGGGEGQLRT